MGSSRRTKIRSLLLGYRRYLLPGIIFQSVIIGGGYATGREIVEFGGKYGAYGLLAIIVMFIGFSLFSWLTFEVARVFQAFNYQSWIKELIFSLWPLFDLLFVSMAVLVLGVLSAATGSIAEEVLDLPYWLGAGVVLLLVVVLNFYGKRVITKFKTIGTIALYSSFLVFSAWVISSRSEQIASALVRADTSYFSDLGMGAVLWAGVLYVGYNLATLPTTLFVLDAHTTRRQTLWAGLVAGTLVVAPFSLTWLCLLGFYPDPQVLDAPVPWIRMLTFTAPAWVLILYGLVVVWTLVETCTGFIHAILERIDASLIQLHGVGLRPLQSGAIAAGVLVTAGVLARFGIIDLIAKGYTAMAYGFLLLMAVPLLTVGLYRVLRKRE